MIMQSGNNQCSQVNAAKRDAFFRAGGDGPAANRYGGTLDRERLNKKEDTSAVSHTADMDKEKEKERERKYGAEIRKDLEGYVGFANLPNQVYRKSVKRGFDFTLMVVGKLAEACVVTFYLWFC